MKHLQHLANGWISNVTEQQSAEVPAGQVISQDPSAVSEDDDTA